jgi:hypothetical protein
MRCWGMSAGFGVVGAVAGALAASGSGMTSIQPLASVFGCGLFGLVGAVLGGVGDLMDAVRIRSNSPGVH